MYKNALFEIVGQPYQAPTKFLTQAENNLAYYNASLFYQLGVRAPFGDRDRLQITRMLGSKYRVRH